MAPGLLVAIALGCAKTAVAPGAGSKDASTVAPLSDASTAPTDGAPLPGDDASGPALADATAPAPDGGADGGVVFDLGDDFSFAINPNGPWRYGYTTTSTLAPDQFALDTFAPDAGPDTEGGLDPIGFWHPFSPATVASGYYPYVADNTGDASASEEASWALRPHEVAMEASNSGQYSVVEFVAPFAGTYQMQVHFEGIHFRLSTTDVHVLAGDAGLFAANISGYGGDPAFHAVEGSNPSADYAGSVTLHAGDVLSFAIGYGTNMTDYNDTTGLTVHLVYAGN